MNKELIASMREQLAPSPEARAALEKKLAETPQKRRVSPGKYIAAAACAALLVGAYPVCRTALSRTGQPPLHSYTRVQAGTGTATQGKWAEIVEDFRPAYTPGPDPAPDSGGDSVATDAPIQGDRDVMMTPEELEDMLLQYGVTGEELEGKELSCTWALWWRYVHENGGSVELYVFQAFLEENQAWIDKIRAWEEEHPREEPNGAIAEGPGDVQEAIPEPFLVDQEQALRQFANLIDSFKAEYGPGLYPDWYGGAWLNNSFDDGVSRLVVAVVREYDSKELCLQVQDWAGGDVLFTDCKYALSALRELQKQVVEEMSRLGLFAGCGVDEEKGYLELTLTDVTDEALAILAKLDPEDDAVRVLVGARAAADVLDADPDAPGTVPAGPAIPTRDGGEYTAPPFDPGAVLRPGDPGYIGPENDPLPAD